MNFLLRPYAVSCGMKPVERRATRVALVKLESVNEERQERGGYFANYGAPACDGSSIAITADIKNTIRMHDISMFSSANTLAIAMIAVCLFSTVFMIRFLIALLLEQKWLTRPRLLNLPKKRKSSAVIRAGAPRHAQNELVKARISARQEISSSEHARSPGRLGVVRLSDENIGQSTKRRWLVVAVALSATLRLSAQTAESTEQKADTTSPTQSSDPQNPTSAASAVAATPLSTPAITGPLQPAPPITLDGRPLGKLNLNGVVSGLSLWQGNHLSGDNPAQAALSNGQVFIQKTSDWWQFYVQAGVYNILAIGTPFLPTEKAITNLYGTVPVAYLKLAPTKNTSILIGALPTLMGAEYTFSFENMNVERGLLWNQENAINRGIQVNQNLGKFTASLSWNDGYYSNRYSCLSGSFAYVTGPHSLSFIGMGNLAQTEFQTLATPVQNNSVMYAAIYTYTKGNWIVQPYYQYSNVPTNPSVGVTHGTSTNGGALLVSHTFKHGLSLAGRGEYLTSTGSSAEHSVNLLYGPGSAAWSITATPTFQYQRFFARGDLSIVRALSLTPGAAFGAAGDNPNQPRGVIELGFMI